MTYLPSPAEATAAAQRLYAKAVGKAHPKSHAPRSQGSSPARKGGWVAPALLGSAAALGAAALYTAKKTRDAERKHPPVGRFLDVDGVRLHYIEQGTGEPLAADPRQRHPDPGLHDQWPRGPALRALPRDRDRPTRLRLQRPPARAVDAPSPCHPVRARPPQLGVEHAIVLGHSWGTMVAVSLALQAPALVRSLVLLSGYYFPTARIDVALNSPSAAPGDRGCAAPHHFAAALSAHAAGLASARCSPPRQCRSTSTGSFPRS